MFRINVDPCDRPPYLSQAHFDRWAAEFDMGDITTLVPQLIVKFSLEIIEDKYGRFSLDKVKELSLKVLPHASKVQTWARKKIERVKSGEELYNLAETLANPPFPIPEEEEYQPEQAFEYIKGIATSVEKTYLRRGEYRHEGREIILYVHVIEREYGQKTQLQAFETAFCHELFHAYHFFYVGLLQKTNARQLNPDPFPKDGDLINRTDATRSIVLESLASYYEYNYCLSHKIPTELSRVWRVNEPTFLPYAGAKYLTSERKFKTIFALSCDVDAALRALLGDSEEGRKQFFMIKNRDYARKLTLLPPKPMRYCTRASLEAVIDYCRERLHATYSRKKSIFYFYTEPMRAFFERHGEDIETKMYICCQPTANKKKLVIFCELAKVKDPSDALEILWTNETLRDTYVSWHPGLLTYRLNLSITVITLKELTDPSGNAYPFEVIQPKLEEPLRKFEGKLRAIENLLNTL